MEIWNGGRPSTTIESKGGSLSSTCLVGEIESTSSTVLVSKQAKFCIRVFRIDSKQED